MEKLKLFFKSLIVFCFSFYLHVIDAQSQNLQPSIHQLTTPHVGIMDDGSVYRNNYLYKGQIEYLGTFGITTSSGEDVNEDGIYEVYNYINISNPELHWLSFEKNINIEERLIPYQGTYGVKLYANTTNLEVGQTYSFSSTVCSEVNLSGTIGGRACVQFRSCFVHVIPYTIPVLYIKQDQSFNNKIKIAWDQPQPLYCEISHYELYARNNDSIRFNELSLALRVNGDISGLNREIVFDSPFKNSSAYYAIVCYDKFNNPIGISKSYTADYYNTTFNLIAPFNNSIITTLSPEFEWDSYDFNSTYKLIIADNETFQDPIVISGLTQNKYVLNNLLLDNKTYFWKVIIENNNITSNQPYFSFGVNLNNKLPSPFSLNSPHNGDSANTLRPKLMWSQSIDNGDKIIYKILLSKNIDFSDIILQDSTLLNEYWVNKLLDDNTTYYWKVIAVDSEKESISSDIYNFYCNYDDFPSIFELITPQFVSNERPVENSLRPTFAWTNSIDSDNGSNVSYTLWYTTDSTFQSKKLVSGLSSSIYTPVEDLEEDKIYYWSVSAIDNNGNLRDCSNLIGAFITNSEDKLPQIEIINPISDACKQPGYISFSWINYDDINDIKLNRLLIARDSIFSDIVYDSGFLINTNSTNCNITNLGTYYWKVILKSIKSDQQLSGIAESLVQKLNVCQAPNNDFTILSPNGGELYYENTVQVISWDISTDQSIKIEYSTDNGASWNVISNNFYARYNSINWLVPTLPSDQYKIKITSNVDNNIFDISDNSFSVLKSSNFFRELNHFSNLSIPYDGNLVTLDIDDDRDFDIISAGSYSISKKWINDNFQFVQYDFDFGGGSPAYYSTADLNNDNLPDIFYSGRVSFGTGCSNEIKTRIYKNNSSNFSLLVELPAVHTGTSCVFDSDNDADFDLFYTGYPQCISWTPGSNYSYFVENNKNSYNIINSNIYSLYSSTSVRIDIENDGDLDLILSGYDGTQSQTYVYLNENGNFILHSLPLTNVHSGSLDIGDFDNNGFLDLLITGWNSQNNSRVAEIYKNINGSFVKFKVLKPVYAGGGKFADFDNDGDLDILIWGDGLENNNLSYNSAPNIFYYENIGGDFVLKNNIGLSGMTGNGIIGDFDSDNDLDIIIIGKVSYGDYDCCKVLKIFENQSSNVNTPPSSPLNLSVSQVNNGIKFSWNHASDNESNWRSLTYNLRIGTSSGENNIMSSLSFPDGKRKIVGIGNVQCDTNWVIKNLAPGTYYWSVQAIDNSYMGGAFSEEQSFTIDEYGALPVELISFSASIVNNNSVKLNWETATEINNYGFEIERFHNVFHSKDQICKSIGFVNGHGNSYSNKSYTFVDNNPPCGRLLYRLKQIDFDGQIEYSNVVEVTIESPTQFVLEQNYPNPFNPITTIKFSIPEESKQIQPTSLKVYDILGKEVATLLNEHKPPGNYEVKFNSSDLPSGVYFYTLKTGNFKQTKKLIIIK